jgi:mycofactocin precursor
MKIAEPILAPRVVEQVPEVEPISLPKEQPQLDILPQQKQMTPELPQILAEVIIEEVSIDGMCGVY